jgi:hypothetical protein
MAALWTAREGNDCSCGEWVETWLRPDDFLCWTDGLPDLFAGDARGDGDANCGGVSAAGDSEGESRELMSIAPGTFRRR